MLLFFQNFREKNFVSQNQLDHPCIYATGKSAIMLITSENECFGSQCQVNILTLDEIDLLMKMSQATWYHLYYVKISSYVTITVNRKIL